METTTQKLFSTNALFTALAASLMIAVLPSISAADGWELRSAQATVPGTREIESGNIEKAIQISRIQLPHTSQQKKVAVLTNLCIGYILTSNFVQADEFCNQAAERPNEKSVSHNNRGVLRALQGDLDAAMADFQIAANAGCIGGCSATKNVPVDLPRPVARRNLSKADYLASTESSGEKEQFASRSQD